MEQERRNKELIMQDATLGTGMCDGSVYRTCTLCDYDICQKCLEIESLPSPEKEEVLKQKVNKIIKKEEARRRGSDRKGIRDIMKRNGSNVKKNTRIISKSLLRLLSTPPGNA
jgi:hypothetical protein